MMTRMFLLVFALHFLGCVAPESVVGQRSRQVPDVVSATVPSLVRIVVLLQQEQRVRPVVNGSGFVVGPDGLVATAAHVVAGIPPEALLVVPADMETFTPDATRASVVALDTQHDLALLRSTAARSKRPLELAPAAETAVGEDALLFGFPLGDPVLTVSKGMIAAKTTRVLRNATANTQLVKLDASVNKGNSGGPLIRVSTGKVIGVASLKEGSIQDRLQKLLRERQVVSMSIGGNDPIELIKTVVQDMEVNLQLGLGYAAASEHLRTLLATHK